MWELALTVEKQDLAFHNIEIHSILLSHLLRAVKLSGNFSVMQAFNSLAQQSIVEEQCNLAVYFFW